ncbi:MAG: hypothetical protein NUW12_01610 [Firmicutes bacterium]|jgi:hypothetical protein|nr:hypothetical protein [Bacillota bacterium]MDH7494859.1 hypothetical protein [Bacillota bacterium]
MRSRFVFFLVLAALSIVAVVDTVRGGLNKFDGIGPVILESELENVGGGVSTDSKTPHVTVSGSLKMDAGGITKFGIANDFGSVAITAGAGDSIEVDYDITVYAESEEEAKKFADTCSVELSASGGKARAQLNRPPESSTNITGVVTKYTVRLPARLKVDMVNRFGEASIDGVSGDVDLENQYGVTRASNLGGSLVARTGFGSAEVSRIAKDADITHGHGRLTLNGVQGDIILRTRYSLVVVSDIAGEVDLTAEHGQVYVADVDGGFTGRTSFSPVSGRNVHGTVLLTSEHGPVEISGIDGEARVQARYAPVRVELGEAAQGYRVEMRARFGNIDADVPVTTGRPVQNEEQATVVVGRGGIPVHVESEFGRITLRTR